MLHAEISQESIPRANALARQLARRLRLVASLPRAGRKVPEFDLDEFRQLLVRPYRVIYRIDHDTIFVISLMHYRQLLPGDLLVRY